MLSGRLAAPEPWASTPDVIATGASEQAGEGMVGRCHRGADFRALARDPIKNDNVKNTGPVLLGRFSPKRHNRPYYIKNEKNQIILKAR